MSYAIKTRTAKEWDFDVILKPQSSVQIKPQKVKSKLNQFHPLLVGIEKQFWAKAIALGNLSYALFTLSLNLE